MTDQIWFTTTETARLLGCKSRTTVVDMIHNGEIKARRRGVAYKIPRSEIERLSRPEAAA